MKIVVLGASGHIGSAIVHELVNQGHDVSGTSRAAAIPENLQDLKFRYCRGDIDTEGQLDQWIEGQDLVIDAAAPYSLNLLAGRSTAERQPLEHAVRRTERLISSLLRHNTKFLYVSSSLIEAAQDSRPLPSLQSTVVRSMYPYFTIKRLIEERIHAATEEGLQAIIVRPTSCVGPWDIKPREMCWIPKLLRGEIPATLRHKINVIDTRDLAAAVAAALDNAAYGETITLSGHNTTTDALLAQLCNSGNVQSPQWGIPAALSIAPLLWIEVLWATIGSTSPLPSLVPTLLCEQRWVETSAAQDNLGVNLRPLAETARDTVSWYQKLGYC
jgi:dihydroflavonol-4-reductase